MRKRIEEVSAVLAEQARTDFASHVQSIAFNLTLSRRMIDCLQAVRDYGWPHAGRDGREVGIVPPEAEAATTRIHHRGATTFVTHNVVGFMGSLKNRGLVYWNPTEWNERKVGDRTILLSRAGELVCELLVEAGLMAPAAQRERKRA